VQSDLLGLAIPACRPLYVPDHRLVPLLAYWHDLRPQTIVVRTPDTGAGTLVVPANARVQRLSILDPNEPRPRVLTIPPGWKQAGANRSWLVYAAPLCHYFER
jgi:hypothetical protein